MTLPDRSAALEVGTFPVERVTFGSPGRWSAATLVVDPDRITDLVLQDPRIRRVTVDLVQPGDDTRIIHPRDVIEPRLKVAGRGHVYPGISGHPADTVGEGVTYRYEGFGVMVCAEVLPHIRRAV
ncbi:MAG: hypothetical protein E6H02_00280, partial [Bacillati bacterium ANGP1]